MSMGFSYILGSKVIKGSQHGCVRFLRPQLCLVSSSSGNKFQTNFKMLLLLHVTSYNDVACTYASAMSMYYMEFTNLGSKVIKGSFPV